MKIIYEQVKFTGSSDIKSVYTNLVHTFPHWHEEIEILFACEGSLTVNIFGVQHTLEEGKIAIINSGEIHAVNSNMRENKNSVVLLHLSRRFMSALNLDIENVRFPLFLRPSLKGGNDANAEKEIKRIILQIIDEWQKKENAFTIAVHGYCSAIIALLTRHYLPFEPENDANNKLLADDNVRRLKRIFSYMHEHYTENPTLSDAAAIACVSPSYLSHFFNEAVGLSYSQYLNSVKINMVQQDLATGEESITDIMTRHGFTNFKTFNRVFKNIVGCSPREYRKSVMADSTTAFTAGLNDPDPGSHIGSYTNFQNHIAIPNDLFALRENAEAAGDVPQKKKPSESAEALIDAAMPKEKTKPFDRYYRKVTALGRACDLLRESIRQAVREAHRDIGFEYIRFHGIFSDEMGILNPGGSGREYTFTFIDEIFDFLLEVGVKPFIEFCFMPTSIASGAETMFFYKGNITPPKDWALWEALVSAFMQHIVNRYTIDEVKLWYFEVWNEPNLSAFWSGGFEAYMQMYSRSSRAVKKVDSRLRIGGPAASSFLDGDAVSFIEQFLARCAAENLPVDFVSAHPYPVLYRDNKEMFLGPDNTKKDILQLRNIVRSSAFPQAELHLDEWNTCGFPTDLTHDTAFMAPFILHNYIDCQGLADSLGYWSISDIFEEYGVPAKEFHGGFGLLNKSQLKKPQYYAFLYLNRLGEEILSQGQNYIVTRTHNTIQILAWNYCHYEHNYADGDKSALDFYDRYRIFQETAPLHYRFILKLPDTYQFYTVEKVLFDREHGSIFDFWLKNGAIEYAAPAFIKLMQSQCIPKQELAVLQNSNNNSLEAEIPPFGFVFFELKAI